MTNGGQIASERNRKMKNVSYLFIAVFLLGLGCAHSTAGEQQINRLSLEQEAAATIVNLFCETKTMEGETTPKKVCWEPKENETLASDQEQMTLVCEQQQVEGKSDKVCRRVANVHCEERVTTGTHIAQWHCQTDEQRKEREITDQLELERMRRNTGGTRP